MFVCLSYMSSLPHCNLLVQLALSSPGNTSVQVICIECYWPCSTAFHWRQWKVNFSATRDLVLTLQAYPSTCPNIAVHEATKPIQKFGATQHTLLHRGLPFQILQNIKDAFAMLRRLGKPTWFSTLSCADTHRT